MKKIIAILMTMMLLVSLTACGGSKESKKESLVGTWKAEVNFSELMGSEMQSEMGEAAEYFDFSDLTMELTMKFNSDSTFSLEITEDAVEDVKDQLMVVMEGGMTDYLEAMLAAEGIDMSLDDFLTMSGMSMDDLMGQMEAELEASMDLESMKEEGKYKAEKGKLYTSDSVDEEVDEEYYLSYKLDGDTLKLDEGSEEADEVIQAMLPLVFKRAK